MNAPPACFVIVENDNRCPAQFAQSVGDCVWEELHMRLTEAAGYGERVTQDRDAKPGAERDAPTAMRKAARRLR